LNPESEQKVACQCATVQSDKICSRVLAENHHPWWNWAIPALQLFAYPRQYLRGLLRTLA
jgi:hypothetical protein